jgi:superfamily II DNA/RNA helicase
MSENVAYEIQKVQNNLMSPFQYLKKANKYLSNPTFEFIGREFVIRALANRDLFSANENLLVEMVRKSGLYPYLKMHFNNIDLEHQLVVDLFKRDQKSEFIFHAVQAKIFNLLMNDYNVVLSAPTSMGKSVIIDSLISSGKYSRVVLVVPTIALIDEVRRRLVKLFGDYFQIVHHGSQLVNEQKKVIFVLTQERVNERNDINDIDLFIIDEFYKLSYGNDDRSRVVALNIALSKLLLLSKQFYMIGPYIDSINGMEVLNKRYTFVPSDFNTVALNFIEYGIGANDLVNKNIALEGIFHEFNGPSIIYCMSQNSCTRVAQFLLSTDINFISSDCEDDFSGYIAWVSKNYGSDWIYTRAMKRGIGIHHGALPRTLQQKTIELFNSRKIKVIICTSTIIEGVNTVAQNVVIYDNRKSTRSIDKFTHSNISGRAGRMNEYLIGNVFCIESMPESCEHSNVVNLPLGQQEKDTPMNLLLGIQSEHLDRSLVDVVGNFLYRSEIPEAVLKNNLSYEVNTMSEGFSYLKTLNVKLLANLSDSSRLDKVSSRVVVGFIKKVEYNALSKLNLHYEDSDELHFYFTNYLYANNHSSYLKERVSDLYSRNLETGVRSERTDRELKIIRSIFKYAIPRSLVLLQDLINHILKSRNFDIVCDLGYLIHVFENSHLPSSFSALEEMGIPIQTLEKLSVDILGQMSLDDLVNHLKTSYESLPKLDDTDRKFIHGALG